MPVDPAATAEAIERIVPRRQLVIRVGDVVLERTISRGFDPTSTRAVYQLCIEGQGVVPELYATFDRAALHGEEIAHHRKVRLYYRDSKTDPPFLLRDFR